MWHELDYGSVLAAGLTSPGDDLGIDGALILESVARAGYDGPSLFHPGDHVELLARLDKLSVYQYMAALVEAGVGTVNVDRHYRADLDSTFDLSGWFAAGRAFQLVHDLPRVAFIDQAKESLNQAVNSRSDVVPSWLVDIDTAMADEVGFRSSVVFFVLHALWSGIDRIVGPNEVLVVGQNALIDRYCDPKGSVAQAYPTLTSREEVTKVVDALTTRPRDEALVDPRYRHAFSWARPLFELPSGWTADRWPHRWWPGPRPSDGEALLVTSEAGLQHALALWVEALTDCEWPLPAGPGGTGVRDSLRARRQQARPKAEFEIQAAAYLREDLDFDVEASVERGTPCRFGFDLRNEIDALVFDHEHSIVWVVEFKDQSRCWDAASVATRLRTYVDGPKSHQYKMLLKAEDVDCGLAQLLRSRGIVDEPDTWSVAAAIFTRHDDPATADRRMMIPVTRIDYAGTLSDRSMRSRGLQWRTASRASSVASPGDTDVRPP